MGGGSLTAQLELKKMVTRVSLSDWLALGARTVRICNDFSIESQYRGDVAFCSVPMWVKNCKLRLCFVCR